MLDKVPVHELNKLSVSQNQLLLLRVLGTSDMTFMYMLYDVPTIHNITHQAIGLLKMELQEECHELSMDELGEYTSLVSDLIEYICHYDGKRGDEIVAEMNDLDSVLKKRMN